MALRSLVTKTIKAFEKPFETLNLIEVSKEALLHNYDHFQALAKTEAETSEIWPVLKANAYGHGITQVAQILKERKFTYFVADCYYEALKIHEVNPQPVLLIGYTAPVNYQNIDLRNVALTAHDIETVKALGATKRKLKVHLPINSGLNREGIKLEEIPDFIRMIKRFPNIEIEGAWSHLADADNPKDTFTNRQEKVFTEALALIEKQGITLKWKHLANTAGTPKTNNKLFNASRLGLGLYLETPALRFISRLVNCIEVSPGDLVGYNCTYKVKEKGRIGLIPAGYYEGIDRRLSNLGFIRYQDAFLPIVGRVCMNLTIVDLLTTEAKTGDEVELIGNITEAPNSIVQMAKLCDTIPYDLLVHLSESVRRSLVR
jgi:alanine racemase